MVAVKLLLCTTLLCTFPIVTRGAFQLLEEFMGGEENIADPVIYAMRTAFVCAAAYCAIAIPSFGKLLGLVGGVCCTALTMTFPPIMLLVAAQTCKKVHAVWCKQVEFAARRDACLGYWVSTKTLTAATECGNAGCRRFAGSICVGEALAVHHCACWVWCCLPEHHQLDGQR